MSGVLKVAMIKARITSGKKLHLPRNEGKCVCYCFHFFCVLRLFANFNCETNTFI